ncbi:MAG: DUF1189 domain-containing protein [Candidatus Melainabacteria bacterium]|nr:MAG: DUF1189 domain-containing protein [Candidatus Melainabacteria bacterium]
MNSYSGLHALYMCFFSKDLYRSVVRTWKGIAFLYLFLLIMTSWLLISVKVYFVMSEVMNGPVKKLIERLPVVEIKDGEFKMDKPSPYRLNLNSTDSMDPAVRQTNREVPIAVFDATTDDVKGDETIPFVVTKHFLYIQNGKDPKAQEFELKTFGDVNYTRESYIELAETIKLWVPIVVFLVAGPISFICCAILSLILAAIGMASANGMNVKLTYGECLRIACVAFTPAVLLDTVLKLLPLPQMPLWPIVGFLAAVGYTIFGVMSNKQTVVVEDSFPGGTNETTPTT